jgi:hypothetical protein
MVIQVPLESREATLMANERTRTMRRSNPTRVVQQPEQAKQYQSRSAGESLHLKIYKLMCGSSYFFLACFCRGFIEILGHSKLNNFADQFHWQGLTDGEFYSAL